MRTKTLFLAAAALAAGLATSQAQSNVYSVNVVGYINVPLAAGANVLVANPLDNGAGNTIAQIDNGAIPNKSVIQKWSGTKFLANTKTAGVWPSNTWTFPPGQGFFVKPNAACTLTFVGSAPTSNNVVMAAGVNALVGAMLPMSGQLTNTAVNPNALNIGSLPNKSVVQIWTGTKFVAATRTAGIWPSNWTINVNQGFFAKPNLAFTWKQWLQ